MSTSNLIIWWRTDDEWAQSLTIAEQRDVQPTDAIMQFVAPDVWGAATKTPIYFCERQDIYHWDADAPRLPWDSKKGQDLCELSRVLDFDGVIVPESVIPSIKGIYPGFLTTDKFELVS